MSGFDDEMHVTKRDGNQEIVSFDKILNRVKKLGLDHNLTKINYTGLVMKIIDQLFDTIPTSKIDELTAEQCASIGTTHYEYYKFAGHIVISNYQKKYYQYNY